MISRIFLFFPRNGHGLHPVAAATLWVLLSLFLHGCQPTVFLMPTPVALRSGELDPFRDNPNLEASNKIQLFYATNRVPIGLKEQRYYTTAREEAIRLGEVELEIGSEQTLWEQLHAGSTVADREEQWPLRLIDTHEEAVLWEESSDDPLSPDLQYFFHKLNERIDNSLHRELTIYIHGANNNFYRGAAQAGQFQHFTGHNAVVMLFAWPSAASLFRYATDVANTAESAPGLARLLTLLARHSTARHINILAYSAGAMVLSPALKLLHNAHEKESPGKLFEKLRLGEIYYAAPDVDFRGFLYDLAEYRDMTCNVTLTVNLNDFVLGLARGYHKTSRAGAPDLDELNREETRWLIDASRHTAFDILDVGGSRIPGFSSGAHDFWYQNPWVSSDVLVQFLYHARPAERDLVQYRIDKGVVIWHFPEDYPERIVDAVKRLASRKRNPCQRGETANSDAKTTS